jgi:hypothetical protein
VTDLHKIQTPPVPRRNGSVTSGVKKPTAPPGINTLKMRTTDKTYFPGHYLRHTKTSAPLQQEKTTNNISGKLLQYFKPMDQEQTYDALSDKPKIICHFQISQLGRARATAGKVPVFAG